MKRKTTYFDRVKVDVKDAIGELYSFKKVENIFKHDLTISQRDALIRDMRFFISKEFKTMIGGNKKSKKKRSSRKK
jgi:hypothetical protein